MHRLNVNNADNVHDEVQDEEKSTLYDRFAATILAYLCQLEGSLEHAAKRLSQAAQTGIDDEFLRQIAEARGAQLSEAMVKALQRRLLGRA